MANNYLVGIDVGRAEGEAEGIFTVASNMLNEGFPIETIIKVTGLTRREVEQIRNHS